MSVPQNGRKVPGRSPKPLPEWEDWDFWRFLLAALQLLWDIVKTTVLR